MTRPAHATLLSTPLARRSAAPSPWALCRSAGRWLVRVLVNRDGVVGALVALGVAALLLLGVHLRADDVAAAQRDRLRLAVSLAASVIEADLSRSLRRYL